MFSINLEQRKKNKEYEKRIKLAQENARKGKFAAKIQQAWKGYKLTKTQVTTINTSITGKLNSIAKLLQIPKIREKFFLTPEKLSPLLNEFQNSLNLRFTSFGGKKTARKPISWKTNLRNFNILVDCLGYCFNLSNPKTQVMNVIYNYFSGYKDVKTTLELLFWKIEVYINFVKSLAESADNASKARYWSIVDQFEEVLGRMVGIFFKNEYLKILIQSTDDLSRKLNIRQYFDNNLTQTNAICYVNSANFDPWKFLDLWKFLKEGDYITQHSILNSISLVSVVSIIDSKAAPPEDIDPKNRDPPNFVELLMSVSLSKHKKFFTESHISLDAILKEIVAKVSNPAKNLDLKVISLIRFQLSGGGKSRRNGGNTRQNEIKSIQSIATWVYGVIFNHSKYLESGKDNYSDTANRMIDFLKYLKTDTLRPSNPIAYQRVVNTIQGMQNFLDLFFSIIFTSLKSEIRIQRDSTTLKMLSENQQNWLTFGIDVLLSHLLAHDFEEFLSQKLNFERLLQLLLYLQNLIAYDFLLMADSSAGIFGDKGRRRVSQVIQLLLEFNKLKSFIPKDFFIMCKLNSFLYENFLATYQNWEYKDFIKFYELIRLFPHCFEFEKRVEIFYHAVKLESRSDGNFLTANIRRSCIVEDGIKTFTHLLVNQNLHNRMKINFYDKFGNLEAGQDDGGLFKEFLYLLVKQVSFS